MWRLIRWLLGVIIVLAIALVAYAYFGNLQPPEGTIAIPVSIPEN